VAPPAGGVKRGRRAVFSRGRRAVFVAVAVAALAAVLCACGGGGDESAGAPRGESLDFTQLPAPSPHLADVETWTARDGTTLRVRTYGTSAPVDLVLVHGSGAWSDYLAGLAAAIADSGAAVVHTPDLRGHGPSPVRRGDVDYVGQLEDDLADLIARLESAHPARAIVVGGHSSGGGLAVRLAGGPYGVLPDGYLLLAPYLGHDAPTTRPDSGGWARPKIERIVGLSILNAAGIRALNDTVVLEFDLPPGQRTGSQTRQYTYRMMTAFNPRGVETDLPAIDAPTLVVVGRDDEAFVADAYPPLFAAHVPEARVELVDGVGHLGLVADPRVAEMAVGFLQGLTREGLALEGPAAQDGAGAGGG